MSVDAVRGMKSSPVNRAKAFEKVKPAKTALTLTDDLVTMWEHMIGKGTRLKNRENTLKKDVAENWVRAAAFEMFTKIMEKLLVKMMSCWMRACKEVIMIFVAITSRTVRTLFGVPTINNMTNRQ